MILFLYSSPQLHAFSAIFLPVSSLFINPLLSILPANIKNEKCLLHDVSKPLFAIFWILSFFAPDQGTAGHIWP